MTHHSDERYICGHDWGDTFLGQYKEYDLYILLSYPEGSNTMITVVSKVGAVVKIDSYNVTVVATRTDTNDPYVVAYNLAKQRGLLAV